MGEGAAVLVLEEWEHAVRPRRHASSARSLGAASNADAHHITAPSPGGAGAVACMELALADAGLDAGDIAPDQRPRHVDAAQRRRRGRGHRARCSATPGPPVTSIKGVTGHALGAAGALEAAAVLLSMRAPPDPADGEHARLGDDLDIDLVTGDARAVGARPDDLEQLRLRRPQRLA